MTQHYDTIIIGSGISGAFLARELTFHGQNVLLLEKGGYHKFLGNHLAVLRIVDRKGFRYTKEHNLVASGVTVGGSSVISAGTYCRPSKDAFKEWGIFLENELDCVEKELKPTLLSNELIGEGNLNLLNAGNRLGFHWQKLPKFIDETKCIPRCSSCMLGCKKNAKYTARTLIEDAKKDGLILQKKKADRVISNKNSVLGVKPHRGHIITADRVIVSAGGIHSSILLQKSGISNAGKSFFMDPLVFTYSKVQDKALSTIHNIPMAVGTYEFYNEGFMQSPIVDPWGLFLVTMILQKNPLNVFKFRHYPRLVGIMTKIQDEKNGTLGFGRFSLNISKKLSQQDLSRLDEGEQLASEVLLEAGGDPKTIFSSTIRGAHPGGSNAIGEVVDADLQTKIPNLFVCDSSILPNSLGTPLVSVLMAFSKRLANFILNSA
ncbi:FAD-dependent oxidoreductase [Candidatus Hodarchaeum mangrovi]